MQHTNAGAIFHAYIGKAIVKATTSRYIQHICVFRRYLLDIQIDIYQPFVKLCNFIMLGIFLVHSNCKNTLFKKTDKNMILFHISFYLYFATKEY